MANQLCPGCGETFEPGFEVCWNCGTSADGAPPSAGFKRGTQAGGEARPLDCLRCNLPMALLGRMKFHEGSRAMPFLLGNVGELFVNRQSFDTYACKQCGKVEFFLAD